MTDGIHPVRSILVVGGGSSGWMTATYLGKVLRGVTVTLVESPSAPIIGVGEATIPFIRGYFARIGLPDDRIWMPECDATFKTGILFDHWYERGDRYWHPLFEQLDYVDAHTHSGHLWLALHHDGDPAFRERRSFYDTFFTTTALNAECGRVPAAAEYAYHLDVHRFLELLRATAFEVRHVVDHVTGVTLDTHGAIAAVRTERSGELVADLYVDCTGFKRLLISAVAPDQPFDSYMDSLFCDSAVVLRTPYGDEGRQRALMRPYVTASAQSGGFIEPLESTGLAIVQMGVEMLASMLDARYFDERMPQRYDAHLEKFYRDIMQFIIAHYALTNREDTAFWRAVKHDTVI